MAFSNVSFVRLVLATWIKHGPAALSVLNTWKIKQDEYVKNQFLEMVERRSAEIENQMRAKSDPEDILLPEEGSAIDLTDLHDSDVDNDDARIHPDDIKEVTEAIAHSKYKDDLTIINLAGDPKHNTNNETRATYAEIAPG